MADSPEQRPAVWIVDIPDGANGSECTTAARAAIVGSLPASGDLRVSVSHTADRALIAIAPGRRIGVDIESAGRRVDIERVADRFFHPNERASLEAAADRRRTFLRHWTAKEAYTKALGTGMRTPFDSFEIDAAAGRPPRLIADDAWTFCALDLGPDWIATLAVEGPSPSPRLQRFDPATASAAAPSETARRSS